MPQCGKCNRPLPANGNCLYCGSYSLDDRSGKRGSVLGAWVSKLIKTLLAAGLLAAALWLIFTDPGHDAIQKIRGAFGSGGLPKGSDTPAASLVRKEVPKVVELLKDGPSGVSFEEETQADGTVLVLVIHRRNDVTTQARFLVDVNAKTVNPADDTAKEWMGR